MALRAPNLVDIEVAQALRRYVQEGELDGGSARAVLAELSSLDLERHSHEPLLGRVRAPRDNLTAYDAVYVALAEVLDATLLTWDRKPARAPSIRTRVKLVEG